MDDAHDLGFMPEDVVRMDAVLTAMGSAGPSLRLTAMDLARFCMVPLVDATLAVAMAVGGHYRHLRRLGFETHSLAQVQKEVAGQAVAYATTIHGRRDIRRARRAASAPGQCINHGYVVGWCCPLWEPKPQTTFLRDALRRFRTPVR